jgi:transketolase
VSAGAAIAAAPPRSSREVYRDWLVEAMARDERVVCLDSDTGLFNGVDFGGAAPRYVNLGIAEQNLLGVAAGLAAAGFVPYVNTMAAFAGTRALETVKIDIALNGLPVRIAATHSGVSAGHLGPTHHALEDLAVMRVLPGMTVLVPADAAETEALLEQGHPLPGPVYLRLGRNPTPDLPAPAAESVPVPPVDLGRARRLRPGGDALIAACGPYPVLAALAAADLLAAEGIEAAVLDLHTVKPLDVAALLAALPAGGSLVTVEEHWRAGGLGSAVAEALTELAPVRVLRVGFPDEFAEVSGPQTHLLGHYGITGAAVAARVRETLPGRAAPGRSSPR